LTPEIRETVEAVKALQPYTAQDVAAWLDLDTSSAHRRLRTAIEEGLVENRQRKARQPGVYCLADFASEGDALPTVVAHTLWVAHMHLMGCCETTPRLAFMSAEKASGKTRALEVTNLLVSHPIFSISTTPAAIVRLVSQGPATIIYDEIDGVFGSIKAQEANVDLRSVLNAGCRHVMVHAASLA
jgi:hypothetical protein